MDKQLRRILNLVRKTGDRMVVTDANGEDVYVVMGLEQYEALVDSCPDDFDYAGVDKVEDGGPFMGSGIEEPELDIPEEFYAPRAPLSPAVPYAPVVPMSDPSTEPPDIWDLMQPAGEGGSTWDLEKLTGAERKDLEEQFAEYQSRKAAEEERLRIEANQVIAPPVTPNLPLATSVAPITPDPKDEEFGEEQFYLEPIE